MAKYINEAAAEFGVKPYRLAAILAQESGYKLDSFNEETKDYGIAQINYRTIAAFGLCKTKLVTDLKYSIKAGALILSDFKRMYGSKEEDYWTRYNSSNPNKREEYKQRVERYF